jgi:predicted dehydrogenase
MVTGSKIRVGIVGVSPNRGFASIAHIPALKAPTLLALIASIAVRRRLAAGGSRIRTLGAP